MPHQHPGLSRRGTGSARARRSIQPPRSIIRSTECKGCAAPASDPAGYVRLWDAAQAGDWAAARAEQERLAALFEIVFQPVGMGGDAVGLGAFKTALRAIGTIDTNVMCAPCPVVTGPAVDAIQDIVKAAGLLV